MNDQNTTPPDMIQQAGELLRRFQHGDSISILENNDDQYYVDGQIVLASAILAVAGEIRELRNVLAAAMSEGSDANGSPISALRIDKGA